MTARGLNIYSHTENLQESNKKIANPRVTQILNMIHRQPDRKSFLST